MPGDADRRVRAGAGWPSPDEAVATVSSVVDGFRATGVDLIEPRHSTTRVFSVRSEHHERPIIAKWCRAEAARREALVYRRILPGGRGSMLRFHGMTGSSSPGQAWIIIDAAVGDPFDTSCPDQLAAVAEWLGETHLHTERSPALGRLPAHGTAHRLGIVRAARDTLLAALENSAIVADERDVIHRMACVCDAFEQCLSSASAPMPPECLEHGDFVAKNLRVRRRDSRLEVEVFDWGAAGRSSPSTDLAMVDCDAYLGVVRRRWTSLDRRQLARLSALGAVSRVLFVIPGETAELVSNWPGRSVSRIHAYLGRLHRDDVLAFLSGSPRCEEGQ